MISLNIYEIFGLLFPWRKAFASNSLLFRRTESVVLDGGNDTGCFLSFSSSFFFTSISFTSSGSLDSLDFDGQLGVDSLLFPDIYKGNVNIIEQE